MNAGRAAADGHKPMARLVSYAVAGVPNEIMGEGPIPASKLAKAKHSRDPHMRKMATLARTGKRTAGKRRRVACSTGCA